MSSKGGLNSVFCSLNFVSSNISFHNTQLDRFSVHGSIRDTNVFEPHHPKSLHYHSQNKAFPIINRHSTHHIKVHKVLVLLQLKTF